MPNINDAFPSKYLKARDLKDREVTVKCSHVEMEKIGSDRKAVLYFEGKEKGLVLNKTNANKITDLAGSALTEDWAGLEVKLYPTETSFQGEMVECIRIKGTRKPVMQITPTPPSTAHSEPLDADDIPF